MSVAGTLEALIGGLLAIITFLARLTGQARVFHGTLALLHLHSSWLPGLCGNSGVHDDITEEGSDHLLTQSGSNEDGLYG